MKSGQSDQRDDGQHEGCRGENVRSGSSARWLYSIVAVLMVLHAFMLGWGAIRHSPTWDEVGFLPAGISHWQLGKFELYPTNPPLVRLVAAVPVVLVGPATDWSNYSVGGGMGPTQRMGSQFIEANGERSFWLFALARWACIPFSLVGGYICFRWARELYGDLAGVLALGLWCFSPNILGHGQLITPDVGATALGALAMYLFWHWLKGPTWPRTLAAALGLGLVQLTKMTWIVLFPLWPLMWLAWRWSERRDRTLRAWFQEGGQLGLILLLALYILNLGYGLEGSLRRLGNYRFASRALGGERQVGQLGDEGRNRFRGTWLGEIPVPLPENYLRGIDRQRWDFETKLMSYLRGEWRRGGWWYYYIYALAIKVPLGTWVLVVVALLLGTCVRGYSGTWRDELILLAPLVVVLTLVSSQTGFNHHLRYVLLIFPFAFIWASKVARAVSLGHWRITALAAAALIWSVGSSLWIYPHSLSYFNELVGGPTRGHAHLHNSNTDWGQDLLYLKRWLEKHPETRPLGLACYVPLVDPQIAGIEYTEPPPGPDDDRYGAANSNELGPQPGWYALSVNKIRSHSGKYAYFLHFEPVAMAGYSIYIYHITLKEANRVRRELKLSELPDLNHPSGGGSDEQEAG